MTDNEIIKALECCRLSNTHQEEECDKCPYEDTPHTICQNLMAYHSLDLINRQKAEIERLEERLKREAKCQYDLCGQIVDLKYMLPIARADAVKEFAERLKKTIHNSVYQYWNFGEGGYYLAEDTDDDIDNLVKEFTEGKADEDK